MASLTVQCGQSADDAAELNNNTGFDSTATSYILQASATSSLRRNFGCRFPNVTIPKSSTILTAHLTLNFTSSSRDDPDCDIFCEATDNSADFSSNQHVTNTANRPRTTLGASWVAGALGTGDHNSPDITAAVQAVINRSGWVSGNALTCLLIMHSVNSPAFDVRTYDGSTSLCPRLVITYTPVTKIPVLMAQYRQRWN